MKKSLEELLLAGGELTLEELEDVRHIQTKNHLRLEQVILKKGLMEEESLLRVLSEFFGYEFKNKLNFKYDEAFALLPLPLLDKGRLVPVLRQKNNIMVATCDPGNIHYLDDVRRILKNYRTIFVLTTEAEIQRVMHGLFDKAGDAAKEVFRGLEEEYAELDSLPSEDAGELANEAPIIRMVHALLTQAVQERASDIHIEPFEKHLDVRYRIDGILHKRLSPPRAVHAGVVSRIKIMANLNIAENRLPQDGRIRIKISGREIDIRVSIIPSRHGERVVMRLLNKSEVNYSIENIGLSVAVVKDIRRMIHQPNGIFLVTGPTGSGKTTSLYSFLTELNEENRNIITVEDPVEYEIDGISQMQMQDKIGLSFAASLRAILRQDPDVIMVGEIRDEETARIAIQASLTGHFVLSTLHTNDAASAVTRLTDMNIEPYLITSTVRGVLAQRLVRVICPYCKESYRPTSNQLADTGITLSRLKDGKLYRGSGCDQCVGTGYRGRIGIYELLMLNVPIQKIILSGSDSVSIKHLAEKQGMHSLLLSGMDKVIQGVTTIDELLRVT